MKLKDILKGIKFKMKGEIRDINVERVTCDSRTVKTGDLFIAFNGYSLNGHKFIAEAISRGARAIVSERAIPATSGICGISVRDTRLALPIIADNFYCHPSGKMKLVGVTGTNGKTTITYLMESILKECGSPSGIIGTINYRLKDKVLDAKNTTPGPLELSALLSEMAGAGIEYCVMEVSSHALDQHRVDGLKFDVSIFTNVTSEHLDYHKSIKRYFGAKKKLVTKMKGGGACILNADDVLIASLSRAVKDAQAVTYGLHSDADVRAEDLNLSLEGSTFRAMTPAGSININTRLMGEHNVSNILACIAASYALNVKAAAVKRGVEALVSIPGRLEEVGVGQPFKLLVDYAHTEAALRNVLSILRKSAAKNIITVFGCGGNRDKKKRPKMGIAAAEFSNHVIITSDNPRFEEPLRIIEDIEKGVRGAYSNYEIIEDRLGAIEKALAIALPGDIVLIAGKGHEKHQIIKDKIMPFDDREVAKAILKRIYAGRVYNKDNKREVTVR
ncbi:MAG: UDP-N-acetylmuramoyl-L-alanyl-D-glutamate--2,6-diaminopimelate ligase [Omnitrophica bacterium RIFCSPLOWO2_01_FULL_45_10]|nr:MAG: UDP-N-acetylmuramoyl-L-alanyl-D-glutamate--2,6-diaminopimelate ligase [Omnitrophica bacterium RIFCSPLOWO2_01_FULL_45_10]